MNQLQSYFLTNNNGMRVEIINFGARIKSILFPVDNSPMEMTLGYDDSEHYLYDVFYFGATCGRVANRISGASFTLNGKHYQLTKNDGKNCLHGGKDNFSLRYWQQPAVLRKANEVTLMLLSKEGDQGFPGTVALHVTYHLSHDNRLLMTYKATTTQATPFNITNHCYFNLGEENCLDLSLAVDSRYYLEKDEQGLPTARVLPVANSDFCFNTAAVLGQRQSASKHPQLVMPKGYDHCFILNQQAHPTKPVAVLTSLQNKVKMSLYTNQPALQLYTGAFLTQPFSAYQGVCLEAQHYCDAVNLPHLPSSILEPNASYEKFICYHFEDFNGS